MNSIVKKNRISAGIRESSSGGMRTRHDGPMRKALLALAGIFILASCGVAVEADVAPLDAAPHKVFVCKYVGTPGDDERLQTGDNPISVDISALKNFVTIGSFFNDAQGRSVAIAFDTGQPEPSVTQCPGYEPPPPPPTTTTTTTTTLPNNTTTTSTTTTTTTCPDCGINTVVITGPSTTTTLPPVPNTFAVPGGTTTTTVGATTTTAPPGATSIPPITNPATVSTTTPPARTTVPPPPPAVTIPATL